MAAAAPAAAAVPPTGRFAQLRERLKSGAAGTSIGASNILQGTLAPIGMETIRLFPESIILASGLFALFTISYPMTVFFGTMIETSLMYRLVRSIADYLTFSVGSSEGSAAARRDSAKCRSGFYQQADFTDVSLLAGIIRSNAFPSYPVFIVATAASYVFNTLNKLSKELEISGPAYASRYYTTMIFSALLLFVLIAYRALYGCESYMSLLLTAGIGILLGVVLVYQNTILFGKEGINLIGIPILRNRTATGQNIYICPK
jgi:hypothetical protein